MITLAFVLSTIGTICVCASSLVKGKDMRLILLLVFLANTFVGASYIFTGAFNGLASCALGAVQTVINYFFDRKNKPLPKWLVGIYALAFTVVNLLVFSRITDIFALMECFAFILSIAQKSGKQYRLWNLANAGLWLTYDLCTLSFGPVITHGSQLLITLFGMIMYDRKKNA